ncbi:MAG: ABC transporter permease [Spirochaetota bacterium]
MSNGSQVRAPRTPGARTFTKKMLRVAGMEFRLTAANKAFVVITIIGPFLIVAMSILPSLLAMGDAGGGDPSRVALVGNADLQAALEPAFESSAVQLVDPAELGASATAASADTDATEQLLREALRTDRLDGYVVLPNNVTEVDTLRYVTSGGTNFQLIGTLEGVIGQAIVARRLSEAGFDAQRVQSLTRPPSLDVRRIDAEGREETQDVMSVMFTTLAFTFLLYMTILLYGQSIGTSVLREKTSKTVEIMLSSMSPRELLVGKIAGKAVASLLQYAIWIGMAVLFLQVLGPMFNIQISLAGGQTNYFYLVGFFLLAFFLYSTIYAAFGAASEDEQHMSQLAWPVIFFLVIPMVMIGATTSNPDGTLPQILSIFPLTSPIVMFQRLLIGSPAIWEVALCLGLLLGTIALVAMLAAKIFRVGILMTGKRFSFGEIVKWLRYRG